MPLLAFSQQSILVKELPLLAGEYNSSFITDTIENAIGLKLSFATKSLKNNQIKVDSNNPTIESLLELLFDSKSFYFKVKPGKILILKKRLNSAGHPIITISGFVEDLKSGERLIGANIYIPGTSLGTITNAFGFYSLSVPFTGSLKVSADLIGFIPSSFIVSEAESAKHLFALEVSNQQLTEVVVTAQESDVLNTQMSQIEINSEDLKNLPSFFGEVDLIKAIQFLPGVQATGEGGINYIVRGGNPDQNLILLDGVTVYNASHLFGFFSVFNPDAVKNIQLTKGGFPAHFGGRLSSVLEVDMKEGNLKEYHGSGSIGILAAKFSLEGPIIKDKTSFMVSTRRTYSDVLYRPFIPEGNDAGYYFADLNVKLNHKFSRKDRLYLSFYNGLDKAFSEGGDVDPIEGGLKWGNYTSALRWNHLFNNKLFGNLTATYTRYNFQISSSATIDTNLFDLRYFSKIIDQGLKYDLDYVYSPKHTFKGGASYTYHNFKPGVISINQTLSSAIDIDSTLNLSPANFTHDFFLYAEDNWTVNNRLKFNIGAHVSSYLVDQKTYFSFQPRLAGRFLMSENWSLKASYVFMQQYIHLLTNSSIGLPTDLWVTSTGNVPPQNSSQVAFGSTHFFGNKKWTFTSEVYHKKLGGLIAYREATSFAPAVNWETQVVTGGTGRAYGWENFIRWNTKKTHGWISYTISKSERQFDELNRGKIFPYKYDRRHDFKIVMSHDFTPKFNLGFTWIYNTGIKATIPISTYTNLDGRTTIRYSDRNAFIYPAYHRLDVSMRWTKKTSWGDRSWAFSIYNVYNRKNPFIIYYSTSESERTATKFSLFQFIPSFNYSFRF